MALSFSSWLISHSMLFHSQIQISTKLEYMFVVSGDNHKYNDSVMTQHVIFILLTDFLRWFYYKGDWMISSRAYQLKVSLSNLIFICGYWFYIFSFMVIILLFCLIISLLRVFFEKKNRARIQNSILLFWNTKVNSFGVIDRIEDR